MFFASAANTGSGPGSRYSGIANSRTVSSQIANTIRKDPRVHSRAYLCVRMETSIEFCLSGHYHLCQIALRFANRLQSCPEGGGWRARRAGWGSLWLRHLEDVLTVINERSAKSPPGRLRCANAANFTEAA